MVAAARSEGFAVALSTEGARTVVRVVGELDMATAPLLRDALADAVGAGADVVLDAAQLAFCDSTGLSVLLRADRLAREAGGAFTVRRPSRALSRLFDLTGVAHVLRVEA